MNTFCVLLFGGLFSTVCESRTVIVTSSTCDGTYSISEDDPLYLDYLGASLGSDCRFSVSAGVTKRVCSKPVRFDVDCETKLEYYKTFHSSSYEPDKRYGCNSKQTDDVCSGTSQTLHVLFKNTVTNATESIIKLQFHTIEDDPVSDIVDAAVTTVYVIIGIVVAVIVLVIIVVGIFIYFFCRRRSSHAGAVYRAPQPSVVTTTTTTTAAYPKEDKVGYQSEQHGQQLQAGNQPEFQFEQSEVSSHTSQQGYAWYHTGFDNTAGKASASSTQQPS